MNGETHDSPSVAVFAPALLLVIELHDAGDRVDVHLHAGGQGYWVSRMIRALGGVALPCAPIGGEPGVALRAIVEADGLDARLTSAAQPNGVVIEDRRGDERARMVVTEVPRLGRHEIDDLYSSTIGAAVLAKVCVLCGSQTAPALPDDVFRRLASDLRNNGVYVVADLSGGPLRAALRGGVDVVKLSHEELRADGWCDGDNLTGVATGIRRLRRAGASSVVISRSERSTICGFDDQLVEMRAPLLEVVDGRGGGDSMTAALAVAASRGTGFNDALRLAAAAGALNVSRHGLGTGRRDAIEELARAVELRPARFRKNATIGDLDAASKTELYELARVRSIAGRSRMNRNDLITALRAGDPPAPPGRRRRSQPDPG